MHAKTIYLALVSAFLVSVLGLPASAQNVYKCGNTYSQAPCATDAAVVPLRPNGTANLGGANRIKDIATPEQMTAQESLCVAGVKASLKDPESARFNGVTRNGLFFGAPGPEEPSTKYASYSGYVNAKNSYGGYVGDKLFFCSVNVDATKVLYVNIYK